ncbi:MAG: multidrug DMT transporter permease [Acidobacteria bacterium]|nr:multidrug DMT transporter permease [Acidobacteriota bacterium]
MGSRSNLLPYAAFCSVCFFWGTTYLTIRMALESLPPVTLVATRFLLSGGILMAWALWKGWEIPRGKELVRTCLFGFMMLGIANGCLTFAETWIPSSLAALLLTTAPFWLVGLESLMPGGEKVTWPVAIGLLAGLGGVILLLVPSNGKLEMGPNLWKGFVVLQVGSLFWNAGSILQRRWRGNVHPLMTGAVQQLAAGSVYFLARFFVEERPVVWTTTGVTGLLWLVTFGSIVGYSSYIYALETLPVSLVSVYTYVNPVVAVVLGRLYYQEPFGSKEFAAMAVIFAGVLIVKLKSVRALASSRQPPRQQSSEA